MNLSVVEGDGWDPEPQIRPGVQARFADELGSGPFPLRGLVWRQVERPQDWDNGKGFSIQIVQVRWDGLRTSKAVAPGEVAEFPIEATSTARRWPIPWSVSRTSWFRPTAIAPFTLLDESLHLPVCARCGYLWPCKHDWTALAERDKDHRRRVWATIPECARCGRHLRSAMSIEFGDPPRDVSRLEGLALPGSERLREVGAGFVPPEPVEAQVVFCGKVGACRNAAYRYAAEHGWELPLERDSDATRRPWRIRAKRAST